MTSKAGAKRVPANPRAATNIDPLILTPGYAGNLDDDDLANIVEHLRRDGLLRVAWGLGGAERERYPRWLVQAVAMYGDPSRLTHNSRLVSLARWCRRQCKSTSDKAIAEEVLDLLRPIVANAETIPQPSDVADFSRLPPRGASANPSHVNAVLRASGEGKGATLADGTLPPVRISND